jgi:RimJ/RimL family protein N-acetyltransferase
MQATHGRFVTLEPWKSTRHQDGLFAAIAGPVDDALWQYIPFGPPQSASELGGVLTALNESGQWQTLILCRPETGDVLGMASYMRIRPDAGSAEVGSIVFSKRLQQTAAATESIYRMARHVFDERGYRRFEWKCDNENAPSRRAASRFGFEFEGIFRQDMVVRGRNRDTAWFSMLDHEWPRLRAGFEAWLAPENFDGQGQQRMSLVALREQAT